MASKMDAISTEVDSLSPLVEQSHFNHVLRSPVRLGDAERRDPEEEEEEEEEDTVDHDFFPSGHDSAQSNQTTPDWSSPTSNSPTVATKLPKIKSTFRPPVRSSSPTAPNATPANARPKYQDRNNTGGSSPSQSYRAGLKRQLMPSIPARKESFGPQNEGLGSRSKSATNIQTLAQAIATRAQHVAAANALARASNPDTASAYLSSALQPRAKRTFEKVTSNDVDAKSASRRIPTSRSTDSGEFDNEMIRAALRSFQAESEGSISLDLPRESQEALTERSAKNFNERLTRDFPTSTEGFDWSKAGWSITSEIEQGESKELTGTGENDSNDTSHGKFRTSDSDHSVSTAHTSHLDDRHSFGQPVDGQSKSSIAGLGIAEAAEMPLSRVEKSHSSSSPVDQGTSMRSLDSFATAPVSNPTSPSTISSSARQDLPFPTTSSTGNATTSSPLLSSPKSEANYRKSRPLTLTLSTLPQSPSRTPSTTSIARSLASPSSRGKTPPPTMPPSEPLPPVPPTPSSAAYKRFSTKSSHHSSPRVSALDSFNPLTAAFIAMASGEQDVNQTRRGSDSSPRSTSLQNSSSNGDTEQAYLARHRSTKSISGLATKSAAMVTANHVTTLAGAESAQAVLDQVKPEPSYNEKRASMKSTSKIVSPKRSSDPIVPLPRRRSSDVDSKDTMQAAAASTVVPSSKTVIDEEDENSIRVPSSANDNGELPYDRSASEGEEDEEGDEEAVLTRVTSINGSNAKQTNYTPRLIRTDSGPIITTTSKASSDDHLTPLPNVTDQSGNKAEAETTPRRVSAGPPSAWSGRPGEKTLSGSNGLNSIDSGTPLPLTPTMSISHSDYGHSSNTHGKSSVQSRRNEMVQDRGSVSPDDTFQRLKRTEGRFTGAFGEVASAFKQLQAEKKTLEKVIRATTPLAGVGNGVDLSQYLTSMSSKLSLSIAEIKRLLDLLDQQRNVMDYMLETHQLQLDAYQEEIEEFKEELDAVEMEAETHRTNCIKLTENLDGAHGEIIAARAETLRAKGTLSDEVSKRDKFTRLLRMAREDLSTMDSERSKLKQAQKESEDAHSATKLTLESTRAEHALELQSQKEAHEKEMMSLRSQYEAKGASPSLNAAEITSSSSQGWEAQIATLQKELQESKASQAASERLLQEHKSAAAAATTTSQEELSVGSLSPLITGPTDVEDALREKLAQREHDIAELRAAIALSGGKGDTKEEQMASLPAGRANQVEMLLADLADKKVREVQMRSAYKQLRDELRKLQLAQQQDRKRTQATHSYLAGSSTSLHGHGTAPPSSYFAGNTDSSAPSSPNVNGREGPSSRALKRLSLPLVSKHFSPLQQQLQQHTSGANQTGRTTTVSPSAQSRLSFDGHGFVLKGKSAASERGDDGDSLTSGVAVEEEKKVEKMDSSRGD